MRGIQNFGSGLKRLVQDCTCLTHFVGSGSTTQRLESYYHGGMLFTIIFRVRFKGLKSRLVCGASGVGEIMVGSTLDLIARYKFIYLLVSLLLLFLIHPLFQQLVGIRILMHILFSFVLCTAIYAVSQRRKVLVIGITLLLPALVGTWSGYVLESATLHLTAMGFTVLFLAFTGSLIVSDVFKEEEVTVDTISGAICVYLLIGLTWAELYVAIEFFQPGSFTIHKYLPQVPGYHPEHQTPLFLYYSFVTLTTLGYGDITPLTPPARSFSYVEAIIGQIFVAVLIARLVGLHIAHSRGRDSQ